MSKSNKGAGADAAPAARPEARIAKGFRDIEAAELKGLNDMLGVIRSVYERYGFDPLETPADMRTAVAHGRPRRASGDR